MNAVRQSCRPKHQVLVLKCYPRFQKNQTSVKPNGSELSYLLYYASTRRSKLQKVGAFLEKRTIADVWHVRIGNVQVSLQIVTALIEKCPRDLPLYAGSVLGILQTVLKSGEATMVESTLDVWEGFCKAQDPAMLAADQSYIRQYEEVVQLYAGFASKEKPQQTSKGGAISFPMSMRFRKLGLEAIKAIANSDTITAETGRQMNLTVPVVLENLYSTDATHLQMLQQREYSKDQLEKEAAMRRRQSISTVRTAEDGEADADAALGTTADADKLAEQDVGISALQALRRIFSTGNRSQLRFATLAVLKFISTHVRSQDHFEKKEYHTLGQGSWPTNLLATICSWTPVHDRYSILVTAMETLIRSPIVESDLEKQYVLSTIVGMLLSSTINFIGLSIMDVLVGLMQHISLLLQLGGGDSDIKPHHQQAVSESNLVVADPSPSHSALEAYRNSDVVMEVTHTPSEGRVKLLNQLLWCIGNLATHVYYADQISDMVTAIMARLKPSQSLTVSAIQDPTGTAETLARSVSLHERPGTDSFFSFDTARTASLQAVKAILIVANGRAPDGSSNAANRSQVGTTVWEGTQWLLRDPSFQVRMAYHDAVVTWLNLEAKRADLKIREDEPRRMPSQKKENGNAKGGSLARRAVSNASQRQKSPGARRSTFVDLLHLAIYDNAHQYAESEQDVILLHSLLCALVQKLGVNSVRSGLPMISRLQEEISTIPSRTASINVASLVHGYFWACSVYFDFDASATARTILDEIATRTKAGTWLQTIRVPPIMPHQYTQAGSGLGTSAGLSEAAPGTASSSERKTERESLQPFDNRSALVDKIAQGYSLSLYSPPNSPPGSPSRSFSQPLLSHGGRSRTMVTSTQNSTLRPSSPSRGAPELPQSIREEMMSDWSKEECIASTTRSTTRSGAGSGRISGRDTTSSSDAARRPRKHLSVGIAAPNSNGNGSINGTADHLQPQSLTPTRSTRARQSTSRGASQSPTPLSTSSVRSAVRVEDLKRVLSGATDGGGALRTAWSMRGATAYSRRRSSNRSSFGEAGDADTGSNSLVSVDTELQESMAADLTVPVNVQALQPPDVESPAAAAETPDKMLEKQTIEANEEMHKQESSPTLRAKHRQAHEDSQHILRSSGLHQEDNEEGVARSVSADATYKSVLPVPPLPDEFFEDQRDKQRAPDTDAASSVYMTPGESPAPPTEFSETPTRPSGGEHEPETPRALRQDYFGDLDAGTPTASPQNDGSNGTVEQTTPREANAVSSVSSPAGESNNRRSVSAHSSKSQSTLGQQKRRSIMRSLSSHTAGRASYTGPRLSPTSTRGSARKSAFGAGSVRGRDSKAPGHAAPAGDVKSLLAGISVDGWDVRSSGSRRPPY